MSIFEGVRPLLKLTSNATKIDAPMAAERVSEAEAQLGKVLPGSFREWLTTVGDNSYLFRGNLKIYPLFDTSGQPCITQNLQLLNQHDWSLDPALIVFGNNGQGEQWAFDAGVSISGEYPVLQIGGIFSNEGRKYKLWNSSFVRFLYSQALWWTRYLDPDLHPPEDETAEENWIRAINYLLDPAIDLGHPSVYAKPQTLAEIRAQLAYQQNERE